MRVMQHSLWIEAAVMLLHAYAEACERHAPMCELVPHIPH